MLHYILNKFRNSELAEGKFLIRKSENIHRVSYRSDIYLRYLFKFKYKSRL